MQAPAGERPVPTPITPGRISRGIWTAAGLGMVALGFVGAIVPGMPATVFFIVALYCFKRSSPRLETWLLGHRLFGRTLRDWDERRGMRRGAKLVALAALWLAIAASCVLAPLLWLRIALTLVAVGVTAYLVRLPRVD